MLPAACLPADEDGLAVQAQLRKSGRLATRLMSAGAATLATSSCCSPHLARCLLVAPHQQPSNCVSSMYPWRIHLA
ncbi:hypothetical protein WJX84_005846 [Apatococcus fuscideae]|uniref:Uncharacterized protein n=1 Tax=Apatococcus fuscideae TaxID=2026836 RepID=A0AAW1TFX1_9CHLO